ncbi:MAG: gliding motility-associated C-terminal domain-containing protein [Pseudoflavonifractor sp.]|nr:gliding motility-associated C-terminal domain-containing protein [Pseudoflavonifractor sp.]
MRTAIFLFTTILPGVALCAQLDFSGSTREVITVTPEKSTGLDDIYVVYNISGVSASYRASTSDVKWYRFSSLGGGYAEEITGIVRNGNTFTLPSVEGDMGYIIEDGTTRRYFWVVDYAAHPLMIQEISVSPESDCSMTAIDTSGSGDRIVYYTINGRQMELDRQLTLSYRTLVWDADAGNYNQADTSDDFPYLQPTLHVTAPLCDTEFTLDGDRFLRRWGEPMSVTSPSYQTIAVAAETTATQTARENDNEQKEEGATLGGSAPSDIEFQAVTTDAVVFNEWQLSRDPEFENITIRINDPVTSYTFREQGTTYVRFIASNAAGSCDYVSPTYEVTIGESRLECPNAFSPGASEGVNDIWKVSYKSIVSFECHIFNRWGIKMISFTNPADGWDGKYNGKLVPSGVYYYVIKATGADGKEYNLKGDINIINYNGTKNNPSNNNVE